MTCPVPWASLMLLPESYGPECPLGSAFMAPDLSLSLRESWNSPQFVALRQAHVDGRLPDACRECEARHIGTAYYDQFETDILSRDACENLERNRNEFVRGKTVLAALPVTISADLLYSCNYSCQLCSLRLRHDRLHERHAHDLFYDLACLAAHVHVSGGEPFLDAGLLKFINSNAVPSVAMSVTTNGSLLTPEILDAMSRLPRVNLHISIDSLEPDTFARLRSGPLGLRDILKQIRMVLDYRDRSLSRPDMARWYVSIQFVAMADNLREIPRFVDAARELGVDELAVCRLDGCYEKHDPAGHLRGLSPRDRESLLCALDAALGRAGNVEVASLARYVGDLRKQCSND